MDYLLLFSPIIAVSITIIIGVIRTIRILVSEHSDDIKMNVVSDITKVNFRSKKSFNKEYILLQKTINSKNMGELEQFYSDFLEQAKKENSRDHLGSEYIKEASNNSVSNTRRVAYE